MLVKFTFLQYIWTVIIILKVKKYIEEKKQPKIVHKQKNDNNKLFELMIEKNKMIKSQILDQSSI